MPQPVDALLSMKMRIGETLRNYASRYWEFYNEIGGGNEKIAAMDAMSRALRRAAQSPFLSEIEQAQMPSRFTWPSFNSYDKKADLVEHVSHYIHMMSLHTHNDTLMCKVFPSSLR